MSLLLALALAAQALHAGSYLHPKVRSGQKTIRSVALLPPTAQVLEVGFFRADFKDREAEPLASAIALVVSNALKSRGWEVNDSAFTGQALENNDELRYLVEYLRVRHQTLVWRIKPKDVSRGRCSLGDRVAALSAQSPVDALVLVYGQRTRLTKAGWAGLAVAQGAVGVGVILANLEKLMSLQISLVDSRTGEVLCHSQVAGASETQVLEELRKVP